VRLLAEALDLPAEAFRAPRRAGLEPAGAIPPSRLAEDVRADLEALVGRDNLQTDAHARLAAAYGKGVVDLLRLRRGIAEHLPDAVVHPRDRQDLARILAYCPDRGLAVTARGAASSVTRGLECPAGGLSLDLRTHLDKVLAFDETTQTITVQPGMYGPRLERLLNRAPELFGARRRYTCGHFPQSFEHSTVGGWAATRGAGQNSTYYGKIEDLVLAQEMVTPAGVIRTGPHPAAATGPDTDQILLGSEGAFGVLAEVTLRVFRWMPGNRRRFSYLFRDWEAALDAARAILQGEFGRPSVFRLSDPAETEVAFRHYGLDRPWVEAVLARLGLRAGSRCLLLGSADGERGFVRNLCRRVGEACRSRGALPCSGLVTRAWEHGRFRDPYLRDDLLDFGILVDTLECAATWDGLERVRQAVRARCLARPRTLCLSHLSHGYPQGASLYFLFFSALDGLEEHLAFQGDILETLHRAGAALSHHHGIGRMAAPWLEAHLGSTTLDLFRAIKRHLDPGGIMNPGGTLALDRVPEPGSDRSPGVD
jgi:alkyldihydroxyacetonephosphate synthase